MGQLYTLGQTGRSRAVAEHGGLLTTFRAERDRHDHIPGVFLGNKEIGIAEEGRIDRSGAINVETGRLNALEGALTGRQASCQEGVLQGVFVVGKGGLGTRSSVQEFESLESDWQELRVREDERRLAVEQLVKEFRRRARGERNNQYR